MAYFPLFMDIKDKKCLVIGGGKVACRKIETLLSYGADVHVISPPIRPEIIDLLSAHGREVGGRESGDTAVGERESESAGRDTSGPDAVRRDIRSVIRMEVVSPAELEEDRKRHV